jgi:uncharacterized tellurite resistance protein B-like protein
MESNAGESITIHSVPGKSPETESGVSSQAATKAITLDPVIPAFDLLSIRCSAESRLHDLIWKDEDLLGRMKAVSQQTDDAKVQDRLSLITDDYHVDEAITPKLFRLGVMLMRILRLALPLDVFVRSSSEMNACCHRSRKGNRLVMCLNSALVDSFSSQELLFCMGHEVGHALLEHGDTLGISFDDPNFSPMEVIRVRALDRAQEISCDRFGLLACQDIRVASAALFKIASGLTEKWICFDEAAYARHFDELSSMAELVELESAARTHPFDPLRVKALIAFSKSETYSKAFGKTIAAIPTVEMEKGVEAMLSVLDPDLSKELENAKEEEAANRFLINGALRVIAADGVVDPHKVDWLKAHFDTKWSRKEVVQDVSNSEFREHMDQELESSARILTMKLSESKRAHLLQIMCDVAVCGGGLPDAEMEALDQLRQLLEIRTEIAADVLQDTKKEYAEAKNLKGKSARK